MNCPEASFDRKGDCAMAIGSITSINSMSGMQASMAGSTDSKNKNIQNEITDVQQQMQALSSKEDLSVSEKANERKKLQKEIAGLNAELKQHQEELRKSQRREIMMAELQEDKDAPSKGAAAEKGEKTSGSGTETDISRKGMQEPAPTDGSSQQAGLQGRIITSTKDGIVILKENRNQNGKQDIHTDKMPAAEIFPGKPEEKNPPIDKLQAGETKEDNEEENNAGKKVTPLDSGKDTGLSPKEMHALVSADNSVQQAKRQETVIAKIQDGIVILKGEIQQDKQDGLDTEKKQKELEKLEQKEQRARAFQSSILGEANHTMKSAAKPEESEAKDMAQFNTEDSAFKFFQTKDPASEQQFYISLTN